MTTKDFCRTASCSGSCGGGWAQHVVAVSMMAGGMACRVRMLDRNLPAATARAAGYRRARLMLMR